MRAHYFEICREAYVRARKSSGAPVMIVHKLSEDTYMGEAKDGSLLVESLGSQCCSWACKFELVQSWSDMQEGGDCE